MEKLTKIKFGIIFIDKLGGTTKVSNICGITRGAVSQWKKKGIPKAQFNFLKLKYENEFNFCVKNFKNNLSN